MNAQCGFCRDGYRRVFDGDLYMHDLPEPAGMVPCAVQSAPAPAADRRGDWIQTFTGRKFYALDPRPGDFHILDIAAGLRNARYSCQSIGVETVAEHSVKMWRFARMADQPAAVRRAVLMHDSSEAYLVDVPRPIKGDLANYREIEDRIMHVCAERFDFPWPMPDAVKALDDAILNDEIAQIMGPPPEKWRQPKGGPLGVMIECWPADRAFVAFLHAAAVEGLV
jgi:hypothetical protein